MQEGRRVIPQQVDARVILAEIESDLNCDVVALSGRRSAIGDTVKLSPVRNGRGLVLTDWSADRYLVPGSIEFTGVASALCELVDVLLGFQCDQ